MRNVPERWASRKWTRQKEANVAFPAYTQTFNNQHSWATLELKNCSFLCRSCILLPVPIVLVFSTSVTMIIRLSHCVTSLHIVYLPRPWCWYFNSVIRSTAAILIYIIIVFNVNLSKKGLLQCHIRVVFAFTSVTSFAWWYWNNPGPVRIKILVTVQLNFFSKLGCSLNIPYRSILVLRPSFNLIIHQHSFLI